MKIVIMGPKGAGKSTLGAAFGECTDMRLVDTDALIETLDGEQRGAAPRSCREIYREDGEKAFRALERAAALRAADDDYCLVVTGGGLMLDPPSRQALRRNAVLVWLDADDETLWERAVKDGLPPWLEGSEGPALFSAQNASRRDILAPYADIHLDTSDKTGEELLTELMEAVSAELAVRMTSANTYGDTIRMTAFGESHGKAIGVVLEGMRPGLAFSEEMIQVQLDRRRPGQSKVVTQRKEPDEVHILSGVFDGKTTGAPVAMVIYNQDQRSKNYDNIKDVFRPGHGDFTFYVKYGFRDYRGGGRQSGRETACRVAAGAVPLALLADRGIQIVAHAVEVAGIRAETCDFGVIEQNPVRCADPEAAKRMEQAILDARSRKDSVGGVIQLEIHGLPPGLGDPIFGKLDARLTTAIMTIGAIKGVEIGDGFAIAALTGSAANDPMRDGQFVSNHSGGILGGISNGAPVIMRVAVKPTASIAQKQTTVNERGENLEIEVFGRHDPCIVPRAVPVIENMAALVVLDAWEVQRRLNPQWAEQYDV